MNCTHSEDGQCALFAFFANLDAVSDGMAINKAHFLHLSRVSKCIYLFDPLRWRRRPNACTAIGTLARLAIGARVHTDFDLVWRTRRLANSFAEELCELELPLTILELLWLSLAAIRFLSP